jgi:hypothetical protein
LLGQRAVEATFVGSLALSSEMLEPSTMQVAAAIWVPLLAPLALNNMRPEGALANDPVERYVRTFTVRSFGTCSATNASTHASIAASA